VFFHGHHAILQLSSSSLLNLGSYNVQPERMNVQLVVKFFAAAKIYLMEMHGFVFYNFISKSVSIDLERKGIVCFTSIMDLLLPCTNLIARPFFIIHDSGLILRT
jgi:hypothetical protein